VEPGAVNAYLDEVVTLRFQLENPCQTARVLDSVEWEASWLAEPVLLFADSSVVLAPGESAVWQVPVTAEELGTHAVTLRALLQGAELYAETVPLYVKLEPGPVRVPEQFARIQEALAASFPGDTVLVAPGTYSGEGNRELSFLGKPLRLLGTGGAAATLLDGEGRARLFELVSGEGSDSVIEGFTLRNGYARDASPGDGGAVYLWRAGASFVGCVIEGCEADAGGGIYSELSILNLTDTRVRDCVADIGGGAYLDETEILFQDALLDSNETERFAGGLYCSRSWGRVAASRLRGNAARESFGYGVGAYLFDRCDLVFEGCEISGQSGGDGAGIYVFSRSITTFTGCDFSDNHASGDGGGLRVRYLSEATLTGCTLRGNRADHGGGIWVEQSFVDLQEVLLEENEAATDGGGVYFFGCSGSLLHTLPARWWGKRGGGGDGATAAAAGAAGAVGSGGGSESPAPSLLQSVTLLNNVAGGSGGGIGLLQSTGLTLRACSLRGNSAGQWGGALHCDNESSANAYNTLFAGNSAGSGGGGVAARGSFTHPALTNCTFTGNQGGGGAGALLLDVGPLDWMRVESCILWGDSAPEVELLGGPLEVRYSDIQGAGPWPGVGNIAQDPLFFTFEEREFAPGPGSPCIDSGDPDLEDAIYDSDPAWPAGYADGVRCDMGAYGGPGNGAWFDW
jgi:hypothetical protein